MSYSVAADARHTARRAFVAGAGVAVATSIHHVYGAIVYHTPWRYHAAVIASIAVAVMLIALRWQRAEPDTVAGRAAWWTFWGVNAVVFVLLIGMFEGVYNHAFKNLLYFGGAPLSVVREFFPPPTYELPNDWFFELTGVLQVVPSAVAAYHLARLLAERLRRATASRPVAGGAR